MKCPNCGLINPETALRCDCGYDFPSGTVLQSYSETDKRYRERHHPQAARAHKRRWWQWLGFGMLLVAANQARLGIPVDLTGLDVPAWWTTVALFGGLGMLMFWWPAPQLPYRKNMTTARSWHKAGVALAAAAEEAKAYIGTKRARKLASVLAAIAFAWFVWPTPYIYRGSASHLLRVNRITGGVSYLESGRWVNPVEEYAKEHAHDDAELPPNALAKMKITCSAIEHACTVANSSRNWQVDAISFDGKWLDADDSEQTVDFAVLGHVAPGTTGKMYPKDWNWDAKGMMDYPTLAGCNKLRVASRGTEWDPICPTWSVTAYGRDTSTWSWWRRIL